MTDLTQQAAQRFEQGFNCSQAVLSVFAARARIPEATALKLASPFGGGIAHQGQTCGAVTGALMAIGLLRGNDAPEGKYETYQLAEEFIARFRESHQTLLCRELIGYDIHTPEGLQQARANNVFHTICPLLVKDAVGLADALIGYENERPEGFDYR